MFVLVSAFPKSLHCTDEAQQAETVLSAVLSIYVYIYIYIFIHTYIHIGMERMAERSFIRSLRILTNVR